ncbi:protein DETOXIFICATION 12-like [Bidens hawaiensis]|uniref:protein DETOXIFICATION 12-like n=1 Tax=Bidens hawaiensis TaxID=980011 RepID=UPI004049E897
MEEGLLKKQRVDRFTWRVLLEEMKKLGFIAGPMMTVTLLQYMLQVTSVMMVGHVGGLALSSTSIAISLSGVTGFSLVMGMSSALETLCGQAYGAQQYKKFGTLIYTAIFSLLIVCIRIAIFWRYTGSLLVLAGQNPLISHEAGKYITWLIPALFAYAILQPLVAYFQTQSMLLPMLASSTFALCLHIPLCWVLVYKTTLGNIGAAISMGAAMWLDTLFLLCYMKYSPSCAKTRSLISLEVFHEMKQFFGIAIPSAVMICLEWWSYELLVLLSEFPGFSQIQSLRLQFFLFGMFMDFFNSLNTISTLYAIPYGFAAGVSTRVSNELGAGNPRGARVAVNAIMILAFVEATIVSMIVFLNRHIFGYIFTNYEKQATKARERVLEEECSTQDIFGSTPTVLVAQVKAGKEFCLSMSCAGGKTKRVGSTSHAPTPNAFASQPLQPSTSTTVDSDPTRHMVTHSKAAITDNDTRDLIWKAAMVSKMSAIIDNDNWDLIPYPSGANIVGCR